MSDFFSNLLRTTSQRLVLPREDEDDINRYIAMHADDRANVESRPFPRQVDFWAFCIATALALKLEPREGSISGWGKTFVYSNQGTVDNDLASLLSIIAVAKFGLDDRSATEIGRIVEHANRLAASGCPEVLRKLKDSPLRTTPLDQALEYARSLQERVYDEAS